MALAAPTWRRPDPLFDYPLTLPWNTAYRELDIALDATDAEVKWAKSRRSEALKCESGELEKRLEEVYGKVAGLREAYAEAETLGRQGGGGADHEDLRRGLQRLRALEKEAERIDPAFRRHRERVAELKGLLNRLNSLGLESPEHRREYDRDHPPIGLLRRPTGTALDVFDDVRTCLFLLRKELAVFLGKKSGEEFHPSDLTREDFSYEFTPNDVLDGGKR